MTLATAAKLHREIKAAKDVLTELDTRIVVFDKDLTFDDVENTFAFLQECESTIFKTLIMELKEQFRES